MFVCGCFEVHPSAPGLAARGPAFRGDGWALTSDGSKLFAEDWAASARCSTLPALEAALRRSEAELLRRGSVLRGEMAVRHWAEDGEERRLALRPSYHRWPAWARHLIPVSKPAHAGLFARAVRSSASLQQLRARLGLSEDGLLAEWLFHAAKPRCGESDLVVDSVALALLHFSRDETRHLPRVVRSVDTYAELAAIIGDDGWLADNLFRLARRGAEKIDTDCCQRQL